MQKIKTSLWLVSFITAIIIPIFIFNSLAFDINYYRAQFLKLDIYSKEPEADKIAKEIINFFNRKSELSTEKLTFAEKSHLADVKRVFDNLRIIIYLLIGLLLFIFFIILKKVRNKDELKQFLAKYFIISSIIMFALIIILVFALYNFTASFQNTHELIFPQGNYAFHEDSVLITLFPEQFFINFVKDFVMNIGAISIVLLVIGIGVKRRD